MGWKNWPYWLKGGIIGLIIGLVGVLLKIVLSLIFIDDTGRPGFFSISSTFITSQLLNCLGLLIIGLIIGWIYGKFKLKRGVK